jgi:hypothetical protein
MADEDNCFTVQRQQQWEPQYIPSQFWRHSMYPQYPRYPQYMQQPPTVPVQDPVQIPSNSIPISPFAQTMRNHRVGERIQSVFGDLSTYTPSTGAMVLTVNLRNVVGFKLRDGCVPRSGYPINACTFTITHSGTDYSVSITAKDYTVATLATELQTLIQAADAALSGYTVTYNTNTDAKYIITGTADFTIDFSATTNSKMLNYALGLSHDTFVHTSSSSVLTSTGSADIQNGKYLYITCPELGDAYGNSDVIQRIHVPDPVNYYSSDTAPVRRFLYPVTKMSVLTLYLYVKTATGQMVPFDNRGHAIDFEFFVLTLVNRRIVERRIIT